MSLTDRVLRIQTAAGREEGDDAPNLEALRQDLRAYVSMDAIASIMADNPERARNELRQASRRVFAAKRWEFLDEAERDRLVEELIDSVFGLGPIEALLADETVTEIMINGARSIFFERAGRLYKSDARFENDEAVRILIDRIISPLGRRIDEASPMVNARLPQGHRVHAIIPPLALDGPVVTIRAFSRHVLTLEEMVNAGSFERPVALLLIWAVLARKNIAVSGGTGSGKTTLLNALSCYIPASERIITIEDSAELKFERHPHVVRLEARPKNAEGLGEVTIRDLVINALRMRPDRIIVGECRGGEALDMLQAMNTGHDGSLTTLHANSVQEVVDRLTTMVRYVVDLPLDAIEAQIGNAFDLVVSTGRNRDGSRYVTELAEMAFDTQTRHCKTTTIYRREYGMPHGRWLIEPPWVATLPTRGLARREEVERWRRSLASSWQPSAALP